MATLDTHWCQLQWKVRELRTEVSGGSHCGKQYGVPQKTKIELPVIQQSHSWRDIQTKLQHKKIHASLCSQQHYLQQQRHGDNLPVHGQTNG